MIEPATLDEMNKAIRALGSRVPGETREQENLRGCKRMKLMVERQRLQTVKRLLSITNIEADISYDNRIKIPKGPIERRAFAAELRAKGGRRLEGYAAVFGTE